MQICDEMPFGFGWITPDPKFMQRASHALKTEHGVYVIDRVDEPGTADRVREPAGVIQLLDRHGRDCWRFADRLGVPLHRTSFAGIPGSPFQVIRISRLPFWKEVALWWPEQRVLVTADALGTPDSYRAPDEAVAVSPLLRLLPPRRLADLDPEHVLCGHGPGIHGPAARRARRRTPARVLERPRGRSAAPPETRSLSVGRALSATRARAASRRPSTASPTGPAAGRR